MRGVTSRGEGEGEVVIVATFACTVESPGLGVFDL